MLLDAPRMANCKTLIANFQVDRICIEGFERDDQPVNCKKLQYPLKEKIFIFQQCLPACKGECRIKSEQNDDCSIATGIYRLTKILQERPQ